jgi:plasmid stabilization system protein ParE
VSREFIVTAEAEADLAEAKVWYDGRQDGLGTELVECVDEAFADVRRLPLIPRPIYRDLRRALVRRFPYAVIYRVTDDRITVVAVYHTSRDPRGWQNRV